MTRRVLSLDILFVCPGVVWVSVVSVSTQKCVSFCLLWICLSVAFLLTMPNSVVCASQGCVCLCLLLLCPEGCLCINHMSNTVCRVCPSNCCVNLDDGRGPCMCLHSKVLSVCCCARLARSAGRFPPHIVNTMLAE